MNTLIANALISFCTIATGLTLWSLWKITAPKRRRFASRQAKLPVSVLKPLCGVDDALESNLETFFQQSHPHLELVFGVEGEDDPAADVVRRLRRRYPKIDCRLVVHDGGRGLNPKVSNLRAMLVRASHDIVVVSDSNIATEPEYISKMLGQLTSGHVGMVTNLIVGAGERSLGARLDNLHLNGYAAGAVAASQALGKNAVTIGKSMMFRRSVLERLGGIESVATLLAEDYVLGRMFQEAGYATRLCASTIQNVQAQSSIASFLRRHLRWGLLRSRLNAPLYAIEPLLNPVAVALGAIGLGAPLIPVVVWAIGLALIRDAFGWWRLRGTRGLIAALTLSPIKEVLMLGVWAYAPLRRTVAWRGKRFRVGAGTRLYAEQRQELPRRLRFEG